MVTIGYVFGGTLSTKMPLVVCVLVSGLYICPAVAQDEFAVIGSVDAQAEHCCILPALTPVTIEIFATINSRRNKIGEHFPIRLTKPILLTDNSEIPAGIMGSGEVIHTAKAGFGGKPGELVLAVRYLDWRGVRIPLRSLSYGIDRPKDNSGSAAAVAIAAGAAGTALAFLITGGEVNIPSGTLANAKTAAQVSIPSTIPIATKPQTMKGILEP